jgi:hypothetical protein
MGQDGRGRKSRRLLVLTLLALAYSVLLGCRCVATGADMLDGAIGVILGLYVCSHPAANAMDRLFFGHSAQRRISSRWANSVWLALNMLALLAGWIAIVAGAMRFTT